MKDSYDEILQKTFAHPDIVKYMKELLLTEIRTDERDEIADKFRFKFMDVASELFENDLGCDYGDDILVRARFNVAAHIDIKGKSKTEEELYDSICRRKGVTFNIGLKEQTFVILEDWSVDGKRQSIQMAVYYTGNEELDRKIDEIVESLHK